MTHEANPMPAEYVEEMRERLMMIAQDERMRQRHTHFGGEIRRFSTIIEGAAKNFGRPTAEAHEANPKDHTTDRVDPLRESGKSDLVERLEDVVNARDDADHAFPNWVREAATEARARLSTVEAERDEAVRIALVRLRHLETAVNKCGAANEALLTAETRLSGMVEAVKEVGAALSELTATVRGECPQLLDEDSGGNAQLSMAVDAALSALADIEGSTSSVARALTHASDEAATDTPHSAGKGQEHRDLEQSAAMICDAKGWPEVVSEPVCQACDGTRVERWVGYGNSEESAPCSVCQPGATS